jgi:16S rRNA (guanine(966)-N(2))-methyltransferase RsmD
MGEIRIVSGKYRGRKILSPKGETTRPLLTRLRKSLADVLRPRLRGVRLLDLFGGTGAIAFELLSNGAESAVIVEYDGPTAAMIAANAKALAADAEIVHGEAIREIQRLHAQGKSFDLIMVAPPYGRDLQKQAMEAIVALPLLRTRGLVVVQRESTEPQWQPHGGFTLAQSRAYGRTVFDFYEQEDRT